MRKSQRKPSVRKKATRRQAPRTARRRARGGGYGAGPQRGGMAPLATFFTSVPGIVVMVAALAGGLFIAANNEVLPGQGGLRALDFLPESVAEHISPSDDTINVTDPWHKHQKRRKISVNPMTYWNRNAESAGLNQVGLNLGLNIDPEAAEAARLQTVATILRAEGRVTPRAVTGFTVGDVEPVR